MRNTFFLILFSTLLIAVGNAAAVPEPATLPVPRLASILRADQDHPPSPAQRGNAEWILKTRSHPTAGEAYVVLTDHTDPAYLKPLERLAAHHHGRIEKTADLAALHADPAAFKALQARLADARYVAIAPRLESFRENCVLGAWDLLSGIDNDPEIDAFPGFLFASTPAALARLVDQSISHSPTSMNEVTPFLISQVPGPKETRSLQKAGVLREFFARWDRPAPLLAIHGPKAVNVPSIAGDLQWRSKLDAPRSLLRQLPPEAAPSFTSSRLVIMHGHGSPGMACSLDADALPNDLSGKTILCGSCFSACPKQSDFPVMKNLPGGYVFEKRDSLLLHAADRGALDAFGHQRLSSGFPYLFPVLDSLTQGNSVGQAYQELINALIDFQPRPPQPYTLPVPAKPADATPRNGFLYVILGDPALKPFAAADQKDH